jgi:hypothetical protein
MLHVHPSPQNYAVLDQFYDEQQAVQVGGNEF